MKRLFYAMGLMFGFQTFANAATDCNQVTEISVTECQSLLELYNSADGANWRNKTGWNQTNTPCSWFGVSCNKGYVTYIGLSDNGDESDEIYGNGLKGQIPNLNLLGLISLNLSSNQLSGNIPNFTNLSNLQLLTLSFNQLTGNIPNFTNLPILRKLTFRSNQLNGNVPNFSNLRNLDTLILSSNQLSGNIPNLANLPNLKAIDLSSNQLSGNIPNFRESPYLQYLYFDSNQLSGTIPYTSSLVNSQVATFYKNCGLTAFHAKQEPVLNQKDPQWKTQNSDCSKAAVCPLASISPTLDLQIPNLNYSNMNLSANLRYVPRDNKMFFEVIDYQANSNSCASANLSPDFKLHVPAATFGDIKLWADLQLYPNPTNNDKIVFELVKYGLFLN